MLFGERGPRSLFSPASKCSLECFSPCSVERAKAVESGGGGILRVEIMEAGRTCLFIKDCVCADWINSVITND